MTNISGSINKYTPWQADRSNGSWKIQMFCFQNCNVMVGYTLFVVRVNGEVEDLKDHQVTVIVFWGMVSVPNANFPRGEIFIFKRLLN
jgi:hypothetical protein